jgi:hypothetical protein
VASAVGEGSIAVSFVHRVLAALAAPQSDGATASAATAS